MILHKRIYSMAYCEGWQKRLEECNKINKYNFDHTVKKERNKK